jgi:hypothetical protein
MAVLNAKKQQKLEPSSSPHFEEVIDATDRRFKKYLLRQHLSHWHPISTAPSNHDLELTILDGGTSAILPLPAGEQTLATGSMPISAYRFIFSQQSGALVEAGYALTCGESHG